MDELDRVVREQRIAEEDDWTKRLQILKSQIVVEEQASRTHHIHNQSLQAVFEKLRIERDKEQQRLVDDRAQGDRVIADRVFELRGLND